MTEKQYKKLVEFSTYFIPDEYERWQAVDIPYALATYLVQHLRFALDQESWQALDEIRKSFGSTVVKQVLSNVFYRNYGI